MALAPSSPLRISWTLIGVLSVVSGVVVALVAVPGVRVTTGASAATALDEGVARGLMAAIPVAVALYACRHPAHARFGRWLLAFSAVWFVGSLSSSSSSFVYSVGRVSGWVSVLFLGAVTLAFPSGRLVSRVDRALVTAAAATVIVLYLPSTLLVERYPAPSSFASCDARCPRNAFMVTGHEPALIGGFVAPARDILVMLIALLVAARLWDRIRRANTLVRQTLVPVLVASIGWLLLREPVTVVRRIAPHSGATQAAVWLMDFAMPAIAIAFLVGIVRWHLFVTAAMHQANARLRKLPRAREVRDVLAEVFEDPGLQIGRWFHEPRCWVTANGRTLDAQAPSSGRWVTEIREGDRHVVAIEHDAVLRDEPAFIDTAASLARIAFEGDHLAARTAELLQELTASRARLATAESERRRIVRDLHDGALQPLTVLTLGQFSVARDGSPVGREEWQSKKARDLLKLVVARRGRPAPREWLMEVLWPGQDPGLLSNRLSVALSTLRSVLDPGHGFGSDHFVVATAQAIWLRSENIDVDIERFLALGQTAIDLYRGGEVDEARLRLEASAAAYVGDFLEEDLYEDWAVALREEARALYISVVAALAELSIAAGHYDAAIRYRLRALERDRWDESAHLGLMTALAAAGRHGEARRAYRDYARRMREIGVDPAPFAGVNTDGGVRPRSAAR
jgi:DNA-binding SARP family transcriptional activator